MKGEDLMWRFRIGSSGTVVFGYGATMAAAKEALPKLALAKDPIDVRSVAHLVPYNDINASKERYINAEGETAYR